MRVEHHESSEGPWEIYNPDYRVDIWRQFEMGDHVRPSEMGWKVETFTLSNVDNAPEAIDWAEEQMRRVAEEPSLRTVSYTVYARVYRGPGDDGIVRIYGANPTRNE
jgi:hypothetical protein